MNMKYWGVAFIAAVVSLSAAQAQVSTTSKRAESNFSWSGLYVGAQGGDVFSDLKGLHSIFNRSSKDLSGLAAGVYAGKNMNFSDYFVLGIDTDVLLLSKKHEYTRLKTQAKEEVIKQLGITLVEGAKLGDDSAVHQVLSTQVNFTGATRVRAGFSLGHLMPYVAGGVAYAGVPQTGVYQVTQEGYRGPFDPEGKVVGGEVIGTAVVWPTKSQMKIGYTLGGGLDVAVTDHIAVRAEYRYTDFGKVTLVYDVYFPDNTKELDYKINDFHAGVAFKF
ncbi:outer membrane protein [Bartonella sp. A05]|uniref:outer membrane protein n=1 Tax=Bartonella sp. A05 TaxID=2967261 RepID=UPI0022A92746|nr:outer membrane beta-barrel protein [Bartonella sp. A05]MCZ2203351.1 outer membrane beta-barrel protein [Bartonella sp. A05]MCZ2203352.1 outer membrane beta-barrel protein [Bartonella sp. A05]